MNLLYIAVGGALGAVLRYLAGNAAVKYFNPQLPYGTFIINISGCFLMGLLMTLIVDKGLLPPVWRLFLCVGVLGGFTTFSSFGYHPDFHRRRFHYPASRPDREQPLHRFPLS